MALRTNLTSVQERSNNSQIVVKGTFASSAGSVLARDIKSIVYVVKHFNGNEYRATQDGTNQSLPTIQLIIDGIEVVLDKTVFPNLPTPLFADGVLEVTMHTISNSDIPVTVDECQVTLSGGGLSVLTGFEHILIGTHLLAIGDAIPTIGHKFYLPRPLGGTITSINPANTTSTKVLIVNSLNETLVNRIAEFANPELLCGCESRSLSNLMKVFVGKSVAEVAFELKDYKSSFTAVSVAKGL